MNKYLFPVLITLITASCSFDYSEAQWEKEGEEYPGLVINNFRHTVVRNSNILAKIQAEEAKEYRESNILVLSQVYFAELDDKGKITREATADQGKYNKATEDIEITGKVILKDFSENFTLEGHNLSYSKNNHTIKAPEETEISIKKENYYITGKGFSADTKEMKINFDKKPEGHYEEN
ncbi:LPS export ABC transporter periplasmic protein LptC [Spirochaetia bacterium 38H-sp]|uniref:LPS export ABC transporter periplasmic protein LptC n=1 Tax=Rarispira pelagica TaxID=3141764 RepID=A0ABU9U8Z0_9SPIR